jgi:AraC-like DNA-binding protein
MRRTLRELREPVLDDSPKNLDYPASPMAAPYHLRGTQFFTDPHFRLRVMRQPQHHTSDRQHTHDFSELVVILDGRGQHEVGREVYDISAGDVFVLLGTASHCYPVAKDLSLINILYDPANLRLPRADLGTLPGYHALFEVEPRFRQQQRFQNRLKLDLEQLAQLAKLIAELEDELKSRRPGARFVATAHFMRIIAFVARAYSKLPVEEQRPVNQLSKVLGFMEQHYAEPLNVADLARVAHLSETSLFRLFRQVLDRSPIDYLLHLRVQKAAQMLRRESLRIKEASEAVGFNDSNYFTRQFTKIMGVSPREYQRRQ